MFAASWISIRSLHCDGRLKDLSRTTSLKYPCGAPKFIKPGFILLHFQIQFEALSMRPQLVIREAFPPLRQVHPHCEACCSINQPVIKTPKNLPETPVPEPGINLLAVLFHRWILSEMMDLILIEKKVIPKFI